MGTYFTTTGTTQADVVEELLEPLRAGKRLVEDHLTTEDGEPILWTVEKGKKDGAPYQFIGCYVLREDGHGNWGYKPTDETVGPYFYSVPLKWLDKYPCIIPNNRKGYSDEWRAEIRAEHRLIKQGRAGRKPRLSSSILPRDSTPKVSQKSS